MILSRYASFIGLIEAILAPAATLYTLTIIDF